MEPQDLATLGLPRHYAACNRGSILTNSSGMWKITAAAVTAALHRQVTCTAPTVSCRVPHGASRDRCSWAISRYGERGNRYILTVMDYFTKWSEAYSRPHQEAETTVHVLVGGMISRFGVPETIHTDQGRNFESCMFVAMCEKLGSHKTCTLPLHPQTGQKI